ncbi:hypothetical protein GXP67_02245 [Rhodocytophaga rosea]|uniref:Uncharacterized protein n=1 Tax=Rhodocytophaga rosea TaxID=2704465 RepID=A0A6C0GC90_9BACT|nr:DUF6348 family protein [Rhodocytophaga rosea]QHT65566.1 hypothetical protein GXP67_02245 [Rhodocytophaga rosea]
MEKENINLELLDLLQQHGIQAALVNGQVKVKTHPQLTIDSQVNFQEYPQGVASQLDVLVETPDQQIVECFGDIGETKQQARQNNIKNFCRNSFHPLIACFFDYPIQDINVETWQIDSQTYQVYIGNYGTKSNAGVVKGIPDTLFSQLENYIKQIPFNQSYHWIRWYIRYNQGVVDPIEFLIDNQPDEGGSKVIEAIQWPRSDGYYSVRQFILLKKITRSTSYSVEVRRNSIWSWLKSLGK